MNFLTFKGRELKMQIEKVKDLLLKKSKPKHAKNNRKSYENNSNSNSKLGLNVNTISNELILIDINFEQSLKKENSERDYFEIFPEKIQMEDSDPNLIAMRLLYRCTAFSKLSSSPCQ